MATDRVTIEGTHSAGDIWMYGFHVAHEDVPADTVAGVVAGLVDDLHATSLFTADVVARRVSVARLDDTTGAVVFSHDEAVTHAGTNASWASLPPQLAVAVSLSSTLSTVKGRFYLPALASQWVVAGGRLGGSAPGTIADWAEDLAQALDGASITLGVKPTGSTTLVPVNRIRVGDVFDVQRRRRNRVAESYTTRSL